MTPDDAVANLQPIGSEKSSVMKAGLFAIDASRLAASALVMGFGVAVAMLTLCNPLM